MITLTGSPRELPSVADCERVQTAWFALRSAVLDRGGWTDGPLRWFPDGPQLWLMFPREIPPEALARGVAATRGRGQGIGAWLALDVDPAPLAAAGFERGWSPWWMTAELSAVAGPVRRDVRLQTESSDYGGEHADYAAELTLTRTDPQRAWYAATYTRDGRFAGRAWSFRDGALAGVFDMAVWQRFRRRGFGTALLRTVCAAAAEAGATHAVLNATPEGKPLYETCGFRQLGEGITWWLHPRA